MAFTFKHIFNRPAKQTNLAKDTSASKSNDKRASYKIKKLPVRDIKYEIADIDTAKNIAQNPDNPDRTRLYGIYRYVVQDAHLSSQISVANNKVLSKAAGLYGASGINKEATKMIQKPWFNDLLSHILDTEYWSHSLVEAICDPANQNADITLIPREYVSPDRKQILLDGTMYGDTLPYADDKDVLDLIEFSNKDPFGLLLKAAPNVILKYYARSDWSRASEKFGMPILHLKISSSDEKELDNAEERAANFGTDGYIVTQDGDEAEIIERKNDKLHENYLESIKYCDEQISKLVNGQTASSDTKSFTGAAQVQERVQDDFTEARMRNVKFAVNYTVIPYLINKGFGFLNGLEFDFDEIRNPPKPQQPDPNQSPDPAQKKKSLADPYPIFTQQ